MEIRYKVFEKLKEEGISVKEFREDLSLGGSALTRLKHNEPVKTDTIGKICEYLQCPVEDIMEILFEKNNKTREKVQLQNEIAKLQEKLNRLE